MSVALVVQHAMSVRHVIICGLSGSAIFVPHYLINGRRFKKKCYWTQNVCFNFFYNFCLKHFSFQEEISEITSSSRQVPGIFVPFCSNLNFWTDLRKFLKYQIPWKSVLWYRGVPCWRTDMTELIVALRYVSKALKKYIFRSIHFPLRFGGLSLAKQNKWVNPQMLHNA